MGATKGLLRGNRMITAGILIGACVLLFQGDVGRPWDVEKSLHSEARERVDACRGDVEKLAEYAGWCLPRGLFEEVCDELTDLVARGKETEAIADLLGLERMEKGYRFEELSRFHLASPTIEHGSSAALRTRVLQPTRQSTLGDPDLRGRADESLGSPRDGAWIVGGLFRSARPKRGAGDPDFHAILEIRPPRWWYGSRASKTAR